MAKEYDEIGISQDDDGDCKLQFYYEGRKVSDYLIHKVRMEQIAFNIFIEKACKWIDRNNPPIIGGDYWEDFIEQFKKAMSNENT